MSAVAAASDARRRGLDPERIYTVGLIVVIGAVTWFAGRPSPW